MLLARLVDAPQIVEDAHAAVVREVEPGVLLESRPPAHSPHAERLLATLVLEHTLSQRETLVGLREHACVLADEGVGDAPVRIAGIGDEFTLPVGDVDQSEVPASCLVVGGEDCLEQGVALLLLLFLAESAVAAHDQEDRQCGEREHHPVAAEMHGEHDEPGADEGRSGGEEPSADDRYDTRDAEHCALAAPGAVGERGAHGHHESDERGG